MATFMLGALALTTCASSVQAFVTIDLKADCGAVGDGITNDTSAFQEAARRIEAANGGTLNIPTGTYIVGKQIPNYWDPDSGSTFYLGAAPVFKVKDVDYLRIEGNNALVVTDYYLKFGTFDPETGQPYNPPNFWDSGHKDYGKEYQDTLRRADAATHFEIIDSQNVTINNLESSGNLANLKIGGQWGDTGWQCKADGFILKNNKNVTLNRVYSHNHARDGLMVTTELNVSPENATPTVLNDCSFDYNGRQGVSWVGGAALRAYRCSFSYTGRAMGYFFEGAFSSAPSAGLDIEIEGGPMTRDGYFENCSFIDNAGGGVLADNPKPAEDSRGINTLFKGCTFWGTTNYSFLARRAGFKLEACYVYGSARGMVGSSNPSEASRIYNCIFEDKPFSNGKVFRGEPALLVADGFSGQNVVIENTRFLAKAVMSAWLSPTIPTLADGTPIGPKMLVKNSSFKHVIAHDQVFQCLLRDINVSGGYFYESPTAAHGYITMNNLTVLGGAGHNPTSVTGPRVLWRREAPYGTVGVIAPGTYTSG